LITSWRISAREHATAAFTGEGASAHPGRWNVEGVSVIYTAQSASLAALELLVHIDAEAPLRTFVLFACSFDETLLERLSIQQLPKDWQADPPPPSVRHLGNEWLRRSEKVVLEVPSAIIPSEHNYLLNPTHADFSKVTIADPVPFSLDLRLLRR
jgi:RES domain-containing protein